MKRPLVLAKVVWIEMLRKKDFYILLILLAALTFALMTVDPFGVEEVGGYVLDLGLLAIWLFTIILAVTLATRQIPGEERKRTIFSLLAKPVSRLDLVVGKWLGSWLAVVAASAAFYLLLALAVQLRGGGIEVIPMLQAWVLHSVMLGVVTAISIALSTRMTYGAAATTSFIVQAAIYSIVPSIPTWASYATGVRKALLLVFYYALPHYELFNMRRRLVHDWGGVDWDVFFLVVAYGLTLSLFFICVAWFACRNKRFKRGAAM